GGDVVGRQCDAFRRWCPRRKAAREDRNPGRRGRRGDRLGVLKPRWAVDLSLHPGTQNHDGRRSGFHATRPGAAVVLKPPPAGRPAGTLVGKGLGRPHHAGTDRQGELTDPTTERRPPCPTDSKSTSTTCSPARWSTARQKPWKRQSQHSSTTTR